MPQTRVLIAIVLVNFVSVAGFGLLFPVFAIYGDQIGASATQIAWAIAAFSLGQLISGPAWGKLADQHGRRPILILSLLVGAGLLGATAFATTPVLLVLARFASGLASGSFGVAFAVGSDVSTRETRAKVMGIVGAGFSFGIIFGPAIGGLLAGPAPGEDAFARICWISAGLSLLAAAATFWLLPETLKRSDIVADEPQPTSKKLLRQPAFFVPLFFGLVGTTALAMMEGIFVLFADAVLQLGPFEIGLMFAVMGVVGVVAQAGAAGPVSQRIGEHGMMVVALASLGIGLFTMGASTSVPVALAAMIFLACGYSLLNPAVAALASFAAAASMQGVALGLVQAASSFGRVAGPAAAGPIFDLQGPAAPFYWAGALMVVAVVAALVWRPATTTDAEMSPSSEPA